MRTIERCTSCRVTRPIAAGLEKQAGHDAQADWAPPFTTIEPEMKTK
jgi:hypothetical protein